MSMSESTDAEEAASGGPRIRRADVVVTAVAVAVMLAVAIWLGWGQANKPVRWADVGYAIVSDTEATATFDVFIYVDEPITCHVQALNLQFAVVGVASVEVSRTAGSSSPRLTVPLFTTERANTAVVDYCVPTADDRE